MALYHSAKGSVDYTIVGFPTIVNGVVSGFSSGNYLSLPDLPSFNKLEIQIKFTTSNSAGIQQSCATAFRRLFSIMVWNNNEIVSYNWINNEKFSIVPPSDYTIGATYVVKATIPEKGAGEHTNVTFSYSKNGSAFSTPVTVEIFNSYDTAPCLGTNRATTTQYFRGSIDLNETYIKVNGQPWFGICPIEVKKHQLMGPVGYQISGDGPTVTDGWLSGLNSSSSCKTTQTLPAFQTLELMVNVRYPNVTSSSFTPVLSFTDSAVSQNKIWANASGGHGIIAGPSTGIVTIDNNTFNYITASSQPNGYFIKMTVVKNASDYTYTLSLSLDGQTWTSASANYATNICTDYVSFLRTGSGSASGRPQMNMNISYIKIDGKLWFWQPRETEKIVVNGVEVWTKPQPPASDYTVHGSPTINGTVVSGFSSSNYLTVDKTLPDMSTVTSMELIVQVDGTNGFNPSGSGSVGGVLCPATTWGHSPCIYFLNNANLRILLPNANHEMKNVIGEGYNFNLYYGKVGYIKLVYGSSEAQKGVSFKGFGQYNDWTYVAGTLATDFSGWDEAFALGAYTTNTSVSNWFPGSIDLSQCSITFNGTKWWPFTPWS